MGNAIASCNGQPYCDRTRISLFTGVEIGSCLILGKKFGVSRLRAILQMLLSRLSCRKAHNNRNVTCDLSQVE
eukprot:6455930-Amphidinium_carterae.1